MCTCMSVLSNLSMHVHCMCRYQHSRQLVAALNRFADIRADLPQGWEKKLNREGKVSSFTSEGGREGGREESLFCM